MNEYEKEHLENVYAGLGECTVLLKKDECFPLGAPCKIAAYGSGVRHTVKGGTGSGEVNSRYFVTVEQGLEGAGFELVTKSWLDAYDDILIKAHEQFVKDVKARAKAEHRNAVLVGMGAVMPQPEYELPLMFDADACIYVLSRVSGEGNDRTVTAGDFLLSETEIRDILELNNHFDKFMLVLNVGGVVDLTPVAEVKNILLLSQLGVETGRILADMLLGRSYPSGKLTSTWAKAEEYPDVGSFGEINDSFYKEGIYVGYRWFDAAGKEVLYPFGYGLGYTEFSISNEKVLLSKTKVTVSAVVQNIGDFPGKEILQVYVSCPWGRLDKPVRELAAFAKTAELKPGECQTVTVSFDMANLASYDEENAAYVLEKGNYAVQVGNSSADTRTAAVLELNADVTVRQVKNVLASAGFSDWKPEQNMICQEREADWNVSVIPVCAEDFDTEKVNYDRQEEADEQIENLSDDDLCLLNMGVFDPRGGLASVIGSAAKTVAGAAGETAGTIEGIPSLVMSDGPAGVRISAQYYEDKKGVHPYGVTMPETLLEFMPGIMRTFMGGKPKLPKGAELKEQYCTAIPIGTALAQSWNLEYARSCADVVGSEMERFGIHLWLAPALNIHRSPLCGRNFEYYSEDPLLSGCFAAAMTEGVQAHPGRGVTVKHFAANSQETNRYYSNSVVSERAMREIYLRGFEICVKTAHPVALMTSYNLLNGTHTSESRGLCTDILRSEYGFDGICMTDWVVQGLSPAAGSKYDVPDPAGVAAAGGDLFMPGSKKDYERLKKGFREGMVTRKQLEINARYVKTAALKLTGAAMNANPNPPAMLGRIE